MFAEVSLCTTVLTRDCPLKLDNSWTDQHVTLLGCVKSRAPRVAKNRIAQFGLAGSVWGLQVIDKECNKVNFLGLGFGGANKTNSFNAVYFSFTMLLEKTRRSSEQISTKIALQDQLKFVYQSDKIVDLKAPQNLMLHGEPLINGQENLRRKTQLDILNAVELLNAETTSSEQRINMDYLPLSAISYQLGSLDYVNARALFKEFSISQKNEKLHSAR